MIGCTTLLAVLGILRTHPGRRGSGPGRWTGRDPVTGRPSPRMRAVASTRRCCHCHRAGPLVRRGAVPTARASQVRAGRSPAATGPGSQRGRNGAHCAHSHTGGVGGCLLAEGHGCLLGCLGSRRIAGTIAMAGPARGGSGAGSGPERPRVDRHQLRTRGRGSVGPDLSLARLLGGRLCAPDRQQRAAALAGVHRVVRSPVTTTPSRTGPAGRSSWAAVGLARVMGSSYPGRSGLCHCNAPRMTGSRRPSGRWTRGRCWLDSGARLGPGRGPRPGGRMRATLAGQGANLKAGPGPRPSGLDDHVPA
jgi:hypothetical protein